MIDLPLKSIYIYCVACSKNNVEDGLSKLSFPFRVVVEYIFTYIHISRCVPCLSAWYSISFEEHWQWEEWARIGPWSFLACHNKLCRKKWSKVPTCAHSLLSELQINLGWKLCYTFFIEGLFSVDGSNLP